MSAGGVPLPPVDPWAGLVAGCGHVPSGYCETCEPSDLHFSIDVPRETITLDQELEHLHPERYER